MISIRVAEQADLPALLQIYNEEVLHGTATFDLHPKTLAERQVWFDQHNQRNWMERLPDMRVFLPMRKKRRIVLR